MDKRIIDEIIDTFSDDKNMQDILIKFYQILENESEENNRETIIKLDAIIEEYAVE